jgi:hypothetical protein
MWLFQVGFFLFFLRPALSTLPLALKCAYLWCVIIVMRQYIPGGIVHVDQGRGVHVTGVSAAYTFKLNKNILSE